LYQRRPDLRKDGKYLAFSQTWLGNELLCQSNYSEAEPLLLSAVAIQKARYEVAPSSAELGLMLGQAMHKAAIVLQKQGKHDKSVELQREAIVLFEKLVDQYPTVEEYRRYLGNALSDMAIVLWALDSLSDAEDAMRRAALHGDILAKSLSNKVGYYTGAAWGHFSIGQLLQAQGREAEAAVEFAQALKDLEKAIVRFPHAAWPQHSMARFLVTCPAPQFQDPQRATTHARRALQMNSENFEAWRILAIALYQCDDWARSDEAFARSFKLQPHRDVEDYFYRAIIASRRQLPKEAQQWYRLGMEQWPGPAPVLPWVERLRIEASAVPGINAESTTSAEENHNND
jgi:tetratricopeptide (TPR) repeat protein